MGWRNPEQQITRQANAALQAERRVLLSFRHGALGGITVIIHCGPVSREQLGLEEFESMLNGVLGGWFILISIEAMRRAGQFDILC